MTDQNMIDHACPVEGRMSIESGKPCNWCDMLDVEYNYDDKDPAQLNTGRPPSDNLHQQLQS